MNDARWHWILIQPVRGAATSDRKDTNGHFACMQSLLKHGVDPDIARFGQRVLHFTAGYHGNVSEQDRAQFTAMLVDHGACMKVRDDLLKSTPLGWACRWGRVKMAETLISRGAAIDEQNAEAWATPRAWANKARHEQILALLAKRST